MIEDLSMRLGHSTTTGIIVDCIAQVHRKNFPAYGGTRPAKQTTEDIGRIRAEVQMNKKRIEKEYLLNEKKKICEDFLFGKVKEVEGELVCQYNNFKPNGDWPQTLPLTAVTKDLANNLFIPTKQAVLKKRPELKKYA